jgi:hypothetical protein
MEYVTWVEDIHRKAEQLAVLFLQLGYSNEPARRALTNSNLSVMSVHDYMHGAGDDINGTLVIDEMEALAVSTPDISMGVLRERVFRDVEDGKRVILLSRAPRVAFPAVVGSSLLDDASFAHAPVVKATSVEQMPTCLEDGANPAEVLCRALKELGAEVCASLDRVIYENMLVGEDALRLLNARELEALDGAAITSSNGTRRFWNFARHLMPLRRALDAALADFVDPQAQLADVSSGLWKIERIIRRAVRQRAISAWGDNWRTECLKGDLPTKVLDKATESAYLGAGSLKQLRDPLEWLSLGELLGLKDRAEIGDLGLGAAFWRQFRSEIIPIRNRLAHMRTLRPEDAAEVVKWLRFLELKVSEPSKKN